MRRAFLVLACELILVFSVNALATGVKPVEVNGHSIGETVGAFLGAEPEAQREANACREDPDQPGCARLLGALDRGQRAEISTSGSKEFVLDGGRLVRFTVLIEGAADAAMADFITKFGTPSTQANIQGQNAVGSKWQDHLVAWDTPDVCVTLYQDNNPSLQDRRPLLVVESRTNNRQYTISAKELAQVEVGRNVAPAK